MIAPNKDAATIMVVDARQNDYQDLLPQLGHDGVRLQVLTSGRAALRIDPSAAPELWVVNMNLPDMSGPDLLAMLRWRYPNVPVYLVADDYRPADEITARCSGAEMFLCKPLQSEWLSESSAVR